MWARCGVLTDGSRFSAQSIPPASSIEKVAFLPKKQRFFCGKYAEFNLTTQAR